MAGLQSDRLSVILKRNRQRRIREKASAAAAACCSHCRSEKVGDSIGSDLPCKTRTMKGVSSNTDEQGMYPVLNAQFRLRFDAYRGQVVMSLNAPSPLRFNLDHVPGMKERRDFVMASSNGLLLLCCDGVFYQNHSQNQYYICNPITKQWLSLPPPPRVYGKTNVYFGFIYHPCETCFDNNHDLMRCTNCSCMVVQFPQTTQKSEELLQVHVYASSETSKGEWSSATVQSPKPFCWGTTSSSERAVVHNDCLYWRTEDAGYVVYDPYNNKIHGFISGPPQWQMCARHYEKQRLFKSRDSLWMAQYSPLSGFLRIWKLKNLNNDASGNLKLDDCYWSRHRLRHFDCTTEEGKPPADDDVVAIHPFNPDIVFMQVSGGNNYNSFTECDLRRKSLFQLLRFSHRTSAADIHTLIFPHRRPPPTTSRMVERQMKEPESL